MIPQAQASEALAIAVKRRDKDASQTIDGVASKIIKANVDKTVAALTK